MTFSGVRKTENGFRYHPKISHLFRWFFDRNFVYNPQFKLKVKKITLLAFSVQIIIKSLPSSSSCRCHHFHHHHYMIIVYCIFVIVIVITSLSSSGLGVVVIFLKFLKL